MKIAISCATENFKKYGVVMSLFISDAMAAVSGATATEPSSGLSMFAMPLIFLVIFYFLLWRPQSKRSKEQKEMIGGIQRGDEIVTSGGMLCKVSEVSEKYLSVTIAEGIIIKLQKAAVSTVLPKGTIKAI